MRTATEESQAYVSTFLFKLGLSKPPALFTLQGAPDNVDQITAS